MSHQVDKAIILIESAGKRLELPNTTIARAMCIYHKFINAVETINCDDGLASAAAIAISAQQDDYTVTYQSIVSVFWNMLNKDKNPPKIISDEFKQLEHNLILVQLFIWRALKFDTNYILAHQYLVPFLKSLHKIKEFESDWDVFVNIVWRIVCTAYMTKTCADFDGSQIAAACIYISCRFCRINTDSLQNWPEALAESMQGQKLHEVVSEILIACGLTTRYIDSKPELLHFW